MLTTRFTAVVGCSVPIQSAGMGNLATPALAAAVAEAGGLGTVSVYGGVPPAVVAATLDRLRDRTAGPTAANFILHFVDPEEIAASVAAAAARVRVVDFFYTDPDPGIVELVHRHGALACWQVGSREEAVCGGRGGLRLPGRARRRGGRARPWHRRGAVAPRRGARLAVDVPVLAAGGIGSGRCQAVGAGAAGADGVRVGTRFLAALGGGGGRASYLDALVAARARDTVYTEAFRVGWPITAPHRLLRSCIGAAADVPEEVVGEGENVLTGKRFPVYRFDTNGVGRGFTGEIAAMSLWAGESVGRVTGPQPAADIVRELAGRRRRCYGGGRHLGARRAASGKNPSLRLANGRFSDLSRTPFGCQPVPRLACLKIRSFISVSLLTCHHEF